MLFIHFVAFSVCVAALGMGRFPRSALAAWLPTIVLLGSGPARPDHDAAFRAAHFGAFAGLLAAAYLAFAGLQPSSPAEGVAVAIAVGQVPLAGGFALAILMGKSPERATVRDALPLLGRSAAHAAAYIAYFDDFTTIGQLSLWLWGATAFLANHDTRMGRAALDTCLLGVLATVAMRVSNAGLATDALTVSLLLPGCALAMASRTSGAASK